MFSFEDVNVDLLLYFSFFGLFGGLEGSLVHLLWCNVVQSLSDNLVHIEDFDAFVATVSLLQLLRNCLLAGESPSEDREFERQLRRHTQLRLALLDR